MTINTQHALLIVLLLHATACGENDAEAERCLGPEEAQLRCRLAYIEAYSTLDPPDWVRAKCVNLHPAPGCYFESNKRYNW